jgi:SAM-dependent methyltransferase
MKEIKEVVKEKYSEIAFQKYSLIDSSCCGKESSCCNSEYTIFSESYEKLEGYNSEADLGLGCGLPTEYADIKSGDIVIDLGSGAGNDCFVARALVGDEGEIIGIDMTEAMIDKAKSNLLKTPFNNIHFLLGEIENMPVVDNKADVVISNCVLNLVPDKEKAFAEVYRVLKFGGHFSISDVVIKGQLPESIKNHAEMYAGCVSGALQKDEYLSIIEKSGFVNIQVQKEKQVVIPDEFFLKYTSEQELKNFKEINNGIFSISVYAEKPKCMFDC